MAELPSQILEPGVTTAEHRAVIEVDAIPPPGPEPVQYSGPPPGPPSPGAGRAVSREAINEEYRRLLPPRGVLAGGGGVVSMTWRVVVDFEASMLNAARSSAKGKFIFGPLADKTERMLSRPEISQIARLARRLLENDTTAQDVFSADSMGVLIIVDGDGAYELMPSGPITRGPAVKLRRMLYQYAWPDD